MNSPKVLNLFLTNEKEVTGITKMISVRNYINIINKQFLKLLQIVHEIMVPKLKLAMRL